MNEDPVQFDGVSSEVPDWSREAVGLFEWNPGKKLLRTIRDYERAKKRGWLRLLRYPIVLRHRFWSTVTGADIPVGSRIGGGLLLPHPNGIVVHPEAEIGPNCLLFQGVTVGHGLRPELPVLEGHVDIGAGAKVLGGVRIGAHSKIGANSVVLRDVPPGSLAVGIPAHVRARLSSSEPSGQGGVDDDCGAVDGHLGVGVTDDGVPDSSAEVMLTSGDALTSGAEPGLESSQDIPGTPYF